MSRRRLFAVRCVLAALVAGQAAPAFANEVVLIPSRVIYPGETISLAALKEVTLLPGKHHPDGVATTSTALDGKVAKRTLLPGRYIPSSALREPFVVEQGATVRVYYSVGGLTISAAAITLEPGSAGDTVKVRNSDSGKVITGVVMDDGSIRVDAS